MRESEEQESWETWGSSEGQSSCGPQPPRAFAISRGRAGHSGSSQTRPLSIQQFPSLGGWYPGVFWLCCRPPRRLASPLWAECLTQGTLIFSPSPKYITSQVIYMMVVCPISVPPFWQSTSLWSRRYLWSPQPPLSARLGCPGYRPSGLCAYLPSWALSSAPRLPSKIGSHWGSGCLTPATGSQEPKMG